MVCECSEMPLAHGKTRGPIPMRIGPLFGVLLYCLYSKTEPVTHQEKAFLQILSRLMLLLKMHLSNLSSSNLRRRQEQEVQMH